MAISDPGRHYVALRRLSDADDHTIADVGQTCERVPAAKSGGTVQDALDRLEASGKIRRVVEHHPHKATHKEPTS